MSDLVGNPEDRFSRVAAQFIQTSIVRFLALAFVDIQSQERMKIVGKSYGNRKVHVSARDDILCHI